MAYTLWRVLGLLVILSQLIVASAQQTITGTYSGAFQATINGNGGSYSPATQATCPANAPVSCINIGQPDWCCPSGNTCGWNSGSVGCCAWGQSCKPSTSVSTARHRSQPPRCQCADPCAPCAGSNSGGQGGGYNTWQQSTWQPSSTYWQPQQTQTVYQQPTTVYEQPATTYVAGGGAGSYQTTEQAQQHQTTQAQQYNGYCSTVYEKGPNLPTTAAGQCGTVLILNAQATRTGLGGLSVATWIVGITILHLILGTTLLAT